jgi:hypothetical protein
MMSNLRRPLGVPMGTPETAPALTFQVDSRNGRAFQRGLDSRRLSVPMFFTV